MYVHHVGYQLINNLARVPSQGSKLAAGYDIVATDKITLEIGQRALVGTGLVVAIEEGYEAQIRPRSGLALKFGVTVLNAPGTIDADYRGEIKVLLINHGTKPYTVMPGYRIAQMVFSPVIVPQFIEDFLGDTARGDGGFASTGGIDEA